MPLTEADWLALGEEKSNLPLFDHDNKHYSGLVRCLGMVQDMLAPEYDAANNSTFMERTPLVIAPIPQATPWFHHMIYDSIHRDKRLCLDDSCREDADQTLLANFFYDQYMNHQPKLRLNELVEVVGVMEQDVLMENHRRETSWKDTLISAFQDEEEEAIPLHVPRIQVLWYRKLDLDQLILPPLQMPDIPSNEVVATALSRALSIDTLTASAIWMALLSLAERKPCGTPRRTPYATTLGCASLAILLPDASACHQFQKRLEGILSSMLPLLVTPHLKDLKIPNKKSGRLAQSPLQLPKGATVLLNASEIQAGPLSPQGLQMLQGVQELTSGHQVPYHFDGGMRIPFEADVRVIVLCTAETKSLLPCLLQVKGQPGLEPYDWSESMCQTIREHLAHARSGPPIDLPLQLLTDAQQDFLQRRQEARQRNVTVDEMAFHRWLTLTRLIARGRRAEQAASCDWVLALQLDDSMLSSLS
ncbi:hypothetical protein FisN_36Lh027 [Fistulifera solaris]|uniref:Mini-chromosome maintenance complex-binding protein n=1 Tax=Fistulifera solaris TaxID=1519565 RepID=A0A1Z5JHR1_FISSO|nr:hypothetical protein FisN_36Lh027 [Fistulifera solaris]|eukprot:GAX13476.1 hypothetical protein FisN_36Lh027 [Fistulifera solaris]